MNFNLILFSGLSYRFIILILLIIFPFQHELQGAFGPLVYQNADLDEYLYTKDLIFLNKSNIDAFIENYINILDLNFDYDFRTITGPIYPLILFIFNYNPNFPYLLALICFLSEIINFYLWSNYFRYKINNFYILFFSLMPIPLFFGFIHSSDIIYFLLSTIIVLNLLNNQKRNSIFYIVILLIVFLRPAALSVILVLYLYDILKKNNFFNLSQIYYIVLFLIASIYYLPYFIIELNSEKVIMPYYFNNNYFIDLDLIDNLFLKKILIIFLKFFYTFGFDPTESGNSLVFYVRSLIAVIFILGFFNTMFSKKLSFENLYIWITILFISLFLYPTYRYLIPIMPLLFLNFILIIQRLRISYFLKKINSNF